MRLRFAPDSNYFRLALALVGALAACMTVADPAQPQEPARTQDPSLTAGFHCIVMPHAVIDISAGASGRLDAVHVERGDRVSRHQLVAELESGVERAQVALARTRATIDTEVRLRRAGQQLDARTAERIATLHSTRMASAQQRDEADRDASVAALRVREAREKRQLAKLELERAEEVLKQRAVRSPISGVVVDRFKWPGEFVDNDAILRVAQLDPLRVEVILPVAEHRRLQVGRQVTVFPETEPDSPRAATIKVVDPMANPASGTFRATLELPNPGNALLAGIKCNARLADGETAPSPVAPLPPAGAATGVEPQGGEQAEPYAPRVPGSAAPRAPLRSAALQAPAPFDPPSRPEREARIGPAEGAHGTGDPAQPRPPQLTALSAPEPGRAQACRGLGPVSDATAARRLARALSEAGFQTHVREAVIREPNGFIVLTPRTDNLRRTVKTLRAKGVRDLLAMAGGEYASRVALGTYKGPRQAERRRQSIARLGVRAQVVERTRVRSAWWVDVRAGESMPNPETLGATLARLAPQLRARASTCPAPVSASLKPSLGLSAHSSAPAGGG